MRKTLAALFALSLFISCAPGAGAQGPGSFARACILVCADSGLPLYEQNADERQLIASTTKIMTAIVVLENCALDEEVTIGSDSVGIEGSSMYLKEGVTYTVEQLLYGLMLASGNDAATALAIYTAGSCEAFAQLMNEKAQELGMENSSFQNPHGLDAREHYSTARDMAKLACYCMENEDFAKIAGTKSYTVGEQTYVNHNKLLSSCEGALGLKTGYTEAAGRSLVSCVEREGVRLVCVTLGDPDDWNDHKSLYDWAYSSCEWQELDGEMFHFEIPLVSGLSPTVSVKLAEPLRVYLPKGAEAMLRVELPAFCFAPAIEGRGVGRLSASYGGYELGSAELVYAEDAPRDLDLALGPIERALKFLALACAGRPYYMTSE